MVLATVERLTKKQAPCNLYKSMTENKSFFTRDRVFTMHKRVLADNEDTYYYWLKENDEKVNAQFYGQELFALKYQFI